MPTLDHWNPEMGNRGDDLSAMAQDRGSYSDTQDRESYDYVPGIEDGPDDPEERYREEDARRILGELEDRDA